MMPSGVTRKVAYELPWRARYRSPVSGMISRAGPRGCACTTGSVASVVTSVTSVATRTATDVCLIGIRPYRRLPFAPSFILIVAPHVKTVDTLRHANDVAHLHSAGRGASAVVLSRSAWSPAGPGSPRRDGRAVPGERRSR